MFVYGIYGFARLYPKFFVGVPPFRKRYNYHVHAPNGPWKGCPVFNDYTGMNFMPDRRPQYFVAGRSPREEEEPDTRDLEVDYSFFDTHVWPLMVERSPSFGNLKVCYGPEVLYMWLFYFVSLSLSHELFSCITLFSLSLYSFFLSLFSLFSLYYFSLGLLFSLSLYLCLLIGPFFLLLLFLLISFSSFTANISFTFAPFPHLTLLCK